MIEEAQNLELDVLEQLRLLTNLETNQHKLLQIILLGQPELLDALERPELSQLAQRITARYHLSPLNEKEMADYVEHRLAIAGCRQPVFGRDLFARLYQLTRGIPRLVNVVCDRAMLGAYVQNKSRVDGKTLDIAAREVFGERSMGKRLPRSSLMSLSAVWGMAMLLVVVTAGILYAFRWQPAEQLVEQLVGQPLEQSLVEQSAVETKSTASPVEEKFPAGTGVSEHLKWPDDSGRLRSNSQAFQSLFRQWKLDYEPQSDGSPCFFAQIQGMACHRGQSNLEKLRALNRPVVLKLRNSHNQVCYATLIGLGRQVARIEIVGVEQTVSLDGIYKHWDGEFTLLWQQPAVYRKPIEPGDQGEDVYWLSQKMRQINNDSELNETPVYQDRLIEEIKQFQLNPGLISDGIVRVLTLVRLNNELGLEAPQLLIDKS
jgi:general secretion pathway protein A